MKVASYTTDVQYIWKINKLEALGRQQLAQQSMLVSMLWSGGGRGLGAHPQEIFKNLSIRAWFWGHFTLYRAPFRATT